MITIKINDKKKKQKINKFKINFTMTKKEKQAFLKFIKDHYDPKASIRNNILYHNMTFFSYTNINKILSDYIIRKGNQYLTDCLETKNV